MSQRIIPTICSTLFKNLCLIAMAILITVPISMFNPVSKAYAATILTIDVDNIDDNNPGGGCTLREAIDVVNASLGPGPADNDCTVISSGADTPITYKINLPSYTYTLSGSAGEDNNIGGDLDITANYTVTIQGIGANSTIIDGGNIDRVFHIPSGHGINVTLSNLTVQNGQLTGSNRGGGISISAASLTISNSTISDNSAADGGGGIYIDQTDTVTIDNSSIIRNETEVLGGGLAISSSPVNIINSSISNNIAGHGGGGILSYYGSTTLNISNSAIISNSVTGNTQTYFRGGGISINGENMAEITNSTISGNFSSSHGGGVSAWSGTTNLTNVTITNNIADNDNNGGGDGGGIYVSSGTVNIKNTIVAENYDRSGGGPDCFGTFTSLGYNLIGKNLGCFASFPAGNPNGYNDFVGSGPFPLDPLLRNLTGDPAFHSLEPNSPAVDIIPTEECSVASDQRGVFRPLGSGCDIGAIEYANLSLQMAINNPSPEPGQIITFTIQVTNYLTETMTGGIISDTLPTDLNFLETITLDPPLSGTVGSAPPILVTDLEIAVGGQVTITLPVGVSDELAAGTVITNTAWVTSDQVTVPVSASASITVAEIDTFGIYLPLVMRE